MDSIFALRIGLTLIVAAAAFWLMKPKRGLTDYHLLLVGFAIVAGTLVNSALFGKNILGVVFLTDTTGAGKAIIIGYGITLGIAVRLIFSRISSARGHRLEGP